MAHCESAIFTSVAKIFNGAEPQIPQKDAAIGNLASDLGVRKSGQSFGLTGVARITASPFEPSDFAWQVRVVDLRVAASQFAGPAGFLASRSSLLIWRREGRTSPAYRGRPHRFGDRPGSRSAAKKIQPRLKRPAGVEKLATSQLRSAWQLRTS